jgi:hypothetical protein
MERAVHTHEIHITGARELASEIRLALFVFPEVLDVLAMSRSDSLLVVVWGRPRPAEWNEHLREQGYEPRRRSASSGVSTAPDLMPSHETRVPALGRPQTTAVRGSRARRRARSRAVSQGPPPSVRLRREFPAPGATTVAS